MTKDDKIKVIVDRILEMAGVSRTPVLGVYCSYTGKPLPPIILRPGFYWSFNPRVKK